MVQKWFPEFCPSKTRAVLFSVNKHIGPPKLFFSNTDTVRVRASAHAFRNVCFMRFRLVPIYKQNWLVWLIKKLGLLKKIKIYFKKKYSFKNEYLFHFLRPVLEFASVVWNGCILSDNDSLEKPQICAARIITDLSITCSFYRFSIFRSWLEPLSSRRWTAKLVTMYKVHNNEVPQYLREVIPSKINNWSSYNLRSTDSKFTKCHLYQMLFQSGTLLISI